MSWIAPRPQIIEQGPIHLLSAVEYQNPGWTACNTPNANTPYTNTPHTNTPHEERRNVSNLLKTPSTPLREPPTITAQCLPLICAALEWDQKTEGRGLASSDVIGWIEQNWKTDFDRITPKRIANGVRNALNTNSDGNGIKLMKVTYGKKILWKLPASGNPYTLHPPERSGGVNAEAETAQPRKRKATDDGTISATQPEKAMATESPAGQPATRRRRDTSPHREHQPIPSLENVNVFLRDTTVVPQGPLSISSGNSDDLDDSSGPDSSDGSKRKEQVGKPSTGITLTTLAAWTQQPRIAQVYHKAEQSPRPDQTGFGAPSGTNVIRPRNNGNAVDDSEDSPFQSSFAELKTLAEKHSSLQNAIQKDQTDYSHIDQLKKKAQALEVQAAKARQEVENAERSKEDKIDQAKGESGRIQQQMGMICKGLDFGGNLRLALVEVSAESV